MRAVCLVIAVASGCLKHQPTSLPPQPLTPETQPIVVKKPKSKKIGLSGDRVPEGMIVKTVRLQSSAAEAGIESGDLILSVDGASVYDGNRNRMVLGDSDTLLLQVRKPFSAPSEVQVVRGRKGKKPGKKRWSAQYLALRDKMAKGTLDELTQALARMVDPNPDELALAIRLLSKRRHRDFPDILAVFSTLEVDKADYWSLVGAHWMKLKDWKRADKAYDQFYDRKASDLRFKSRELELDLNLKAAELSVEAAWRAGKRKKAKTRLRRFDKLGDSVALRERLGLRAAKPPTIWHAMLAPAPEIDVTLFDGSSWRLSDKREDLVVLNFWASWCGPCKKELPEINKLAEQYKGKPVSFIAISSDDIDNRAAAVKKAESLQLTLPIAHAPAVAEDYGITSLPAIRLLDQKGAIQYFSRGYSKRSIPSLKVQIDALLSGNSEGVDLGHFVGAPPKQMQFYPIPNIVAAKKTSNGLVISLKGSPPQLVDDVTSALEMDMNSAGSWPVADLVDLIPNGVISCAVGERLCRAFDDEGEPKWSINVAAPIVDIQTSSDGVYLATDDSLYMIDFNGGLLASKAVQVRDLNVVDDKAVALIGDHLVGLQIREGSIDLVPVESVDQRHVKIDNHGRIYGEKVEQVISTRHGVAVLRAKGGVVFLNKRNRYIGSLLSDFSMRLFRLDSNGKGTKFGVIFIGRGIGVIDFASR